LIKQIVLLLAITACAHNNKLKDDQDYLTPLEKKRALYYRNLRVKNKLIKKGKRVNIKLTNQEKIILAQHIQMECFKKRIDQIKCNDLMEKRPSPCLKLIKKKKISRINKCLERYLFRK
jgi:hypothetical protein